MQIKNTIEQAISEIIKNLYPDLGGVEVKLERPADENHGDWSSNIALMAAGKLQKNPREVAEEIKNALVEALGEAEIEEISIAGPGFINFKFKANYYQNLLEGITSSFGHIKKEEPKRVMLEFGHPNTHKLPHIGHLYSYIVGASFAKLHETVGDEVLRVNYQGDVGPHVAKCIYGWFEKGKPEPVSLIEKVMLLQECYQFGSKAYDESDEAKEKIHSINRSIYQRDPEIMADWEKTRQWSLDYYLVFEERLGIEQKFTTSKVRYGKEGWRL
jgi:arginyl-tRNA synthetase